MKKVSLLLFFILMLSGKSAFAFYCVAGNGTWVWSGTQDVSVPLDSDLLNQPPDIVNEFADVDEYITCYNQAPSYFIDYLDLYSFTPLGPLNSPDIISGVQVNGTNYFTTLPGTVRVFKLETRTTQLPIKLILKVKNKPDDAIFIKKGDPLMQLNLGKWATNTSGGNQQVDPDLFTWRFFAGNDVILSSGTCEINNNQDIVVDMGELFALSIPTTSGAGTSGIPVSLIYECEDKNVNTEIKMYLSAEPTSFSTSAIKTRRGLNYGAGTDIPALGVEIYHGSREAPLIPNNPNGGFNSRITNGTGGDTIYFSPIRAPNSVAGDLEEGYFNAIGTLIMSTP